MKLRIALPTIVAACIALGIASCHKQQMATTELDENGTRTGATEAVQDSGATTAVTDGNTNSYSGTTQKTSGTGYTHGICDAEALRHNEVCNPQNSR